MTKKTNENSRLEVLATYKGSNGNVDPTFIQMYGGGNTSQSNLDFTFIGSLNHDESEEFYTNNYTPVSNGSEFVFVFEPVPDALSGEYDLLDNGLEPSIPIDGDTTYSLTYGVLISNLGINQRFDTLSGMDYALPEPTSMVMWASVAGLSGLTARRKRRIS